ncbi:MAG TPA: ABC transporter substrate-binding protein [Firmicutes bacterium]|nr:ABC transporter substrate-binding protein [Bacillota bacterium]HHY98061.1 ABC transporter substrate-binding protein [Bacillota bacterium]
MNHKIIAGRLAGTAITILMLVVSLLFVSLGAGAAKQIKIGISQIAEHPALDAARKGFVDGLAEAGYVEGKNLVIDFKNAQGDLSLAQTIAQKFVSDKVDLILAIATPSAQAAANVTNKIPILITAVTDPLKAGLVKDLAHPGTNVTGTSDLNPVSEQFELLLKIVPRAKRIGIIYNAGEVNSVVQVELAEADAKKRGLTIIKATASNTSGVYEAAQSLVGRVDAIYVPTDNTVVTALESVIKVAERNKIPVIAGEENSVDRGCIATVGIDYYRLGKQTAAMAVEVLKGKNPAEMPIQYQKEMRLVINVSAAKAMGVNLPEALVKSADKVIK